MASMVMNLNVWRFGRRARVGGVSESRAAEALSADQAARLAPEWGKVEVRHAHPGRPADAMPAWGARF